METLANRRLDRSSKTLTAYSAATNPCLEPRPMLNPTFGPEVPGGQVEGSVQWEPRSLKLECANHKTPVTPFSSVGR